MIDDDIAALYQLPLAEFTAARDKLAKELTGGGDRAAARQVKALRKPSVAAWAINRVASTQPKVIDELLAATDEVRSAQSRDSRSLRATTSKRNEALQRAASAAASALEGAGHGSASQSDRIIRTLGVASSEDEHREALRAGRLVRDLEPSGFEGFGIGGTVAEQDPADTVDRGHIKAQRHAEQLAADAVKAERRASQLHERAERLEREALDAHRVAEEARRAADEARRASEDARAAADEARNELD